MSARRLVGCLLAAWLAVISVAAHAADRIGVLLLHGELGSPARLENLTQALQDAGYLVSRPDMCWSARRGYEAPFAACLDSLDEAAVRLANLGATSLVVGGFSLGGNGAIAYAAGHPELLGVFALAPAHDARALARNPDIADSVAQAQALAAAGKAEETQTFADIGFGPAGPYVNEIATTPSIYLSFFGPASRATLADNARRLAIPLLWVAGKDDPTQGDDAQTAFAAAPANALNRYIVVAGAHSSIPDKASDALLTWLKALASQRRR